LIFTVWKRINIRHEDESKRGFEEQYIGHLSNYLEWDQLSHAEDWILFEDNLVCISV
jgi:hypothetical protein